MAAWINVDSGISAGSYSQAICFDGAGIYYEEGTGLQGGPTDSTTGLYDDADFTKGDWYHVIFTWDGSDVRLYINGDKTPVNIYPGGGLDISGSNAPFYIGKYDSISYPSYMVGHIDDIIVFDRVLSETEVENIYDDYF